MLTQTVTTTTSGTLKEEAAILQTLVRLSAAWTRGDAAAVSAVFDRDCDHRMLSGAGRVRSGREEFERIFREAFSRRVSREGRTLKFSLTALRFISDDVAIVDGTLTFGAGKCRDGRPLAAGSEAITAVMKRNGGAWLIIACRVGALVETQ